MRPVIGIMTHPAKSERNGGLIEFVGDHYLKSIEKAGGIPLVFPIFDDEEALERYVDMCDGFIVPGGIDVNPLSYGENPHPLLQKNSLVYDDYEIHLIREIFNTSKPVLGICRGIQIINVAMGGTLYQDVSLAGNDIIKHYQQEESFYPSHRVAIEEDSILHNLFGDELYTNSFHHQSLKDVAVGLKVTARAEDGIIEAVEGTDGPFLLAVQWHPECFVERDDNVMLRIFETLVEAC